MANAFKTLFEAPPSEAVSPESLLEMLNGVAIRLGLHRDTDQMVYELTHVLLKGCAADSCFIYLYDEATRELVLRGASNSHPGELGRLRMRLGEGITGWVAQQRRPVAISYGAMRDPRFKLYSALPEDRFEAFLSVPVIHQNSLLGVINIQHAAVHEHSSMEIRALSTAGLVLGEALDRRAREQQALSNHAAQLRRIRNRNLVFACGLALAALTAAFHTFVFRLF